MSEPLSEAEYLDILMWDDLKKTKLPMNLERLRKRKMTKGELERGYSPILNDGYSLAFMSALICYKNGTVVWVG